jgi:hypothetical protein
MHKKFIPSKFLVEVSNELKFLPFKMMSMKMDNSSMLKGLQNLKRHYIF